MLHRPFAEVIARLSEPVDAQAVFAAALARIDPAARRAALARRMGDHVTRLRRARRLAVRARELAAGAGTERALERTERALAATLAPVEFASLLAQREVERALDVAAHAGTHADYLAASSTLFAAVVDVVDDLLPILTAAQATLATLGG